MHQVGEFQGPCCCSQLSGDPSGPGAEAMPVVEPSLPQESGRLLETEAGCRGDQPASELVCGRKGNESPARCLVCVPAYDLLEQCFQSALRTLGKREEGHRGERDTAQPKLVFPNSIFLEVSQKQLF